MKRKISNYIGMDFVFYLMERDDWLGLDQSNNRSIVLGSHMNRSFFGFVELEINLGILKRHLVERE